MGATSSSMETTAKVCWGGSLYKTFCVERASSTSPSPSVNFWNCYGRGFPQSIYGEYTGSTSAHYPALSIPQATKRIRSVRWGSHFWVRAWIRSRGERWHEKPTERREPERL